MPGNEASAAKSARPEGLACSAMSKWLESALIMVTQPPRHGQQASPHRVVRNQIGVAFGQLKTPAY